jgi:hypothetical protein
MAKPKDVTDGLQMMAKEFRLNAERSMSPPQQMAMAGRAMIAEGGANEITRLRRQNEELREALKPFAKAELHIRKIWDEMYDDLEDGLPFESQEISETQVGMELTLGDLRRAVLASQEEKQDG